MGMGWMCTTCMVVMYKTHMAWCVLMGGEGTKIGDGWDS